MASAAYPNLQAKKVKISWADQMEELHEVEELCRKDSITLEEFARLIHHILPKCELDTDKTAHHFQIEDTFVDIMYRDHAVISVSKIHRNVEEADNNKDEEKDKVEDDDDVSSTEESGNGDPFYDSEDSHADDEPPGNTKDELDIPALVDSADETKAVEDSGWQEVVTKKTKQRRAAREFIEREGGKVFYFFCNEANATYMDFVGVVTGLDQLIESAKNEKWAHGYCLEENVVYDFNDSTKPGSFRYFIPNTAYLHKFKIWFEAYQANGDKVPEDLRDFYVFKENSTWPKWTYVAFVTGLQSVRRLVQANGAEFGHAYCLDTNDLVNFLLKEGHFHQQQSKAPVKYIHRFQDYLDKTDLEKIEV